eukprot:gene30867-41064_t
MASRGRPLTDMARRALLLRRRQGRILIADRLRLHPFDEGAGQLQEDFRILVAGIAEVVQPEMKRALEPIVEEKTGAIRNGALHPQRRRASGRDASHHAHFGSLQHGRYSRQGAGGTTALCSQLTATGLNRLGRSQFRRQFIRCIGWKVQLDQREEGHAELRDAGLPDQSLIARRLEAAGENRHLDGMKIIIRDVSPDPGVIDVTPDGEIRRPSPAPLADRIFRVAMLVAALAFVVVLAVALFWFALIAIPIALGAAAVAYAAWRWRMWRARRY